MVRVDPTPNPNSLKITVPSRLVKRPTTYASAAAAEANPLARALFAVPGVTSVFMMADFITVTKDPAASWEEVAAQARAVVERHFGAA